MACHAAGVANARGLAADWRRAVGLRTWCPALKRSSAYPRKICAATNVTITNNTKTGESSRRVNGEENRRTTAESVGKRLRQRRHRG
jgi:hypothetical protein